MEKNQRYAMDIYEAVISLFNKESENYKYNIELLEGTEFFTGLVIASTLLFNNLTDDETTNLEFNHIANSLIVQNMMKSKEVTK